MKLSDLKPNEYTVEGQKPIKLSDLHPESYQVEPNREAAAAPSDISMLESALRGGAQSLTFGAAPAITGALESVPAAIEAATGPSTMQDVLSAYKKSREASKAQYDAAEKANPASYFAGSLAGGVPLAALTGGVSAEAGLAQTAAKYLPMTAKTAAGALSGAGFGALSGVGGALSEGADLKEGVTDALTGAAGGAVLGGAATKLGSMLGGAAESLESTANERAVKATGAPTSTFKKLGKNDMKANAFKMANQEEPELQDSVQKLGKLLREPNILQEKPVVPRGSTPEDILENGQDLFVKSGKAIGGVIDELDTTFNKADPGSNTKFVIPSNIVNEIETQLRAPLMLNGKLAEGSGQLNAKINDIVENIKRFGDGPITFKDAQQIKEFIGNSANWSPLDASKENQLFRNAYGIVNAAIEKSADSVAKESTQPGLYDKYKNLKELYTAGKFAADNALGKSAKNAANRDLGLTDYIAGAAGLASHGGVGAVAGAALNKLGKTYGNSTIASVAGGAAKISNKIGNVSKTLINAPKEAVVNYGQKLIESGGQLEKHLGNVLIKAGERDDIGRNALIYSLMQNSGYRELLGKHIDGSGEGDK